MINIGSLNAGNITNIQVDSLGCNSNTVDVTLTNPTDPTIAVSIVEPTCALGDGQINISGLTDGFNYDVTYTHSVDGAVGPLSLSSTGGVINIGSLNAGNITNIQVDSLGCNSNTVDVTLTNPTDPTIAVSIVEPTCARIQRVLWVTARSTSVV